MKTKLAALGILSTLAAAGCNAPAANAPKVDVAVPAADQMQTFAWKDIHTTDVVFFTYPDTISDSDIAQVLSMSRQLDNMNDGANTLRKQRAPYLAAFTAKVLDSSGQPITPDFLRERESLLAANSKKLADDQAQLVSEQAKPDTSQNKALIARLTKEIANLQKSTLSNSVPFLTKEVDAFHAEMTDDLKSGYAAYLSAWDQEQVYNAQYTDILHNQLGTIVNVDPQPPLELDVTAQPNDKLALTLQSWHVWDERCDKDRTDGACDLTMRDFTTNDSSVTNVGFDPHGGTLSFTVFMPDRTIDASISRIRYGATDGRAYYEGDIVVRDLKGNFLHRGVLKVGVDPDTAAPAAPSGN
jgi:hypothetical protein